MNRIQKIQNKRLILMIVVLVQFCCIIPIGLGPCTPVEPRTPNVRAPETVELTAVEMSAWHGLRWPVQ